MRKQITVDVFSENKYNGRNQVSLLLVNIASYDKQIFFLDSVKYHVCWDYSESEASTKCDCKFGEHKESW